MRTAVAASGGRYALRPDQLRRKIRQVQRALVTEDHRSNERLPFQARKDPGEFVWHSHADTDEVFIVLDGQMTIDFRDGKVALQSGEMFVIPKGGEHRPFADRECKIMLVEKAGTLNTGDVQSGLTAKDGVWV